MATDRLTTLHHQSLDFDVTDAGPADGTPVVLLHGFPQDRSSWDRISERLNAAGMRTYAPDQRGYCAGARPTGTAAYRLEHLARVAADPATGVVLLDVVLGHGAEADPAGSLAPAIAAARAGRDLPVVVSCVGTEADPQGLTRQAQALADAGAEVHLSNAAAARRAVQVVSGGSR